MKRKNLTVLKAIVSTLFTVIEQIESEPETPAVGSHMIHSWTKDGEHYRIANDKSWCTCKGWTYRQKCKHTDRGSHNLTYSG